MTADGSGSSSPPPTSSPRDDTDTTAPTSTRPKSSPAGTVTLSPRLDRDRRHRQHATPAIRPPTPIHAHWNTIGGEENCGVVAVGGGGGVAAGDGTIYFLSPEQLDGSSNGVAERPQPLRRPPGSGAALRRHPGVERQRAAAAPDAPLPAFLRRLRKPDRRRDRPLDRRHLRARRRHRNRPGLRLQVRLRRPTRLELRRTTAS